MSFTLGFVRHVPTKEKIFKAALPEGMQKKIDAENAAARERTRKAREAKKRKKELEAAGKGQDEEEITNPCLTVDLEIEAMNEDDGGLYCHLIEKYVSKDKEEMQIPYFSSIHPKKLPIAWSLDSFLPVFKVGKKYRIYVEEV